MVEIVNLAVDLLQPDPENPNIEDAATFNSLVAAIQEVGLVEPIQVVPRDEYYVIVAGEHRWKAAKHLGMETVPCIVQAEWDEDMRQVNMVRMNALRGRIDPVRFTRLFQRLEEKYGREVLRQRMGLTSDAAFKKVYRETAARLGLKAKKADEEKIRSVDDLALVLNTLFARYGGTLSKHYMFFTFGGKTHLMVQLDKSAFKAVNDWLNAIGERDVNEALVALLRQA
jgi:ParB-like chromosome segregation protein Spo0J